MGKYLTDAGNQADTGIEERNDEIAASSTCLDRVKQTFNNIARVSALVGRPAMPRRTVR